MTPRDEPSSLQRALATQGSRQDGNRRTKNRKREGGGWTQENDTTLSHRCLFFRELPKHFVSRKLFEDNLSIPFRRAVFCESSLESILIEFANVPERKQVQAIAKALSRQNGENFSRFEIEVSVEACFDERVVRDAFLPQLSDKSRQKDIIATPSLRRCLLIERINSDEMEHEDKIQIPSAMGQYQRKKVVRRNRPGARRLPLEILRGEYCEKVVRQVDVRTGMILELESEESVHRILQADVEEENYWGSNRNPDDQTSSTSNKPKVPLIATLTVPVEISHVKSENYARHWFQNVPFSDDSDSKPTLSSNDGGLQNELGSTQIDDVTEDRDENQPRHRRLENKNQSVPVSTKKKEVSTAKEQEMTLAGEKEVTPAKEQKTMSAEEKKVTPTKEQEMTPADEKGVTKAKEVECRKNVELDPDRTENVEASMLLDQAKEQIKSLEAKLNERKVKYDELKSQYEEDKLELIRLQEEQRQSEVTRERLEQENHDLLESIKDLEVYRERQAKTLQDYDKLRADYGVFCVKYRNLEEEAEKLTIGMRSALEERDSILAEYNQLRSTWESKFQEEMKQKRAAATDNNHEARVCLECETVQFYLTLENSKTNCSRK